MIRYIRFTLSHVSISKRKDEDNFKHDIPVLYLNHQDEKNSCI